MVGVRFLCGAAVLLSSSAALAQCAQWTLSEASGRVVIRDAAGDYPAQRGSVVAAGATLMTGPGARAVAVRGEDFVTVAANSRLRVPEAAQAAGLFQMIEEWGSAVFKVKHLAQPHFAVQTPYLAAVVKGTTFSVTVTGEGASLQVIDGAVEVATTDGGAHELVRPGVIAQVAAADRFRLAVQGQTGRVIESPLRPATGPGGKAGAPAAAAPPSENDAVSWSDVSAAVIAAPIAAKPVDLAAVTGGLVAGKSGVELAAVSSRREWDHADAGKAATSSDSSAAVASKESARDTSGEGRSAAKMADAAVAARDEARHAKADADAHAAAADAKGAKDAKDDAGSATKPADASDAGKDAGNPAGAKDPGKDDAKTADPKDSGKDDEKPADTKDSGKGDGKPADTKDLGKDDAKPADTRDSGKDDAKPGTDDAKSGGKDDGKADGAGPAKPADSKDAEDNGDDVGKLGVKKPLQK